MLLDRLLGRTSKRAAPKSASALSADALRDAIVSEAEENVPRFADLVSTVPTVPSDELGEQGWHTFGEAVRDVARAAFSYEEPKVRPRDEMQASHLFNREVLAQVLASSEFEASRMYTSGNAEESLFTSIALAGVLQENAEKCGEHVERSEDANAEEEIVQDAERKLEELREQGRQMRADAEAGGDGISPEEHSADVKKQIARREAAIAKLAQIRQEHAQSGRRRGLRDRPGGRQEG